MTPEQKQKLANRILNRSEKDRKYYDNLFHSPGHAQEEYDIVMEQMRAEFYKLIYPVESAEYEIPCEQLGQIRTRPEELAPLLGLATTGPISGNPYVYLTMLIEDIADWDTALKLYWERINKSYLKDN